MIKISAVVRWTAWIKRAEWDRRHFTIVLQINVCLLCQLPLCCRQDFSTKFRLCVAVPQLKNEVGDIYWCVGCNRLKDDGAWEIFVAFTVMHSTISHYWSHQLKLRLAAQHVWLTLWSLHIVPSHKYCTSRIPVWWNLMCRIFLYAVVQQRYKQSLYIDRVVICWSAAAGPWLFHVFGKQSCQIGCYIPSSQKPISRWELQNPQCKIEAFYSCYNNTV